MQEEVSEDVLVEECATEAPEGKEREENSTSLQCVPWRRISSAKPEDIQVSRVCQTHGIKADVSGEFLQVQGEPGVQTVLQSQCVTDKKGVQEVPHVLQMQQGVREDFLVAGCTKETLVIRRTTTYRPSL